MKLSPGGVVLGANSFPAIDSVVTIAFGGDEVDGEDNSLLLSAQILSVESAADHRWRLVAQCLVVGSPQSNGRRRYEKLLRSLLIVGNPIVTSD